MIKKENSSPMGHGSHLWVKEIKEDDHVRDLYVAKVKRLGLTKRGDPFLSITLADRTGDIEARVWDNADKLSSLFREGDILEVEGHASSYRNQVQLTLKDLKPSDGIANPSLFLESTEKDITEMMGSLRDIVNGIKDSHLKKLINRFVSDQSFVALFKEAPAAKNFHHNYIGGLLEHTLSVCRMILSVAEHYPELDRDLLIAGAFLHDIGKVREFESSTRIDYTDEGRLLGHLVQGIEMLDEKLSGIKKFPRETAIKLKHLMLSHHGQYDFGSPKRPKFLEAFALNLIDDLDAKMNGLARFMDKDRQEGAWSEYNRMFERYLLKGKIPEIEEAEEPGPPADDRQKALFSK